MVSKVDKVGLWNCITRSNSQIMTWQVFYLEKGYEEYYRSHKQGRERIHFHQLMKDHC